MPNLQSYFDFPIWHQIIHTCPQTAMRPLIFVAKAGHLHILDRISAQTWRDVFKKFPFHVKYKKSEILQM